MADLDSPRGPSLARLAPYAPLARTSDRAFFSFNAVLSAFALAFLAWILVIRKAGGSSVDLSFLPAVNASLNAVAAILLTAGYVAIKRRALRTHKYLMVGAFTASSLFLVCYLIYHYVHGDTRYPGHGTLRTVYLLVLASHVLLSMSIVPLTLTSFYFALKGTYARHRAIGKITFPIWLYVSVTGVLIFWMLRTAT